jgi:hypothetical protein
VGNTVKLIFSVPYSIVEAPPTDPEVLKTYFAPKPLKRVLKVKVEASTVEDAEREFAARFERMLSGFGTEEGRSVLFGYNGR